MIARNAALYGLGFTAGPTCVHAKGGTYRVNFALWLSPDRDTAVVLAGGTMLGIPCNRTKAYSRRGDGTFIQTLDDFPAPDVSGLVDSHALPNAAIHDLIDYHRRQLAGVALVPYTADVVGDLADMCTRQVCRAVELGYARYDDPARTVWRYTARGAWRLCWKAVVTMPARRTTGLWRLTKSAPRLGFDVRPPPRGPGA